LEINIHPAEEKDLMAIYDLIAALAAFENEPHEPTVSFKQFTQDFNRLFHCLVAKETETQAVVGIALYYFGYSTWKGKMLYLDDLVVKEGFRQLKIGSKLFNAILSVAQSENANQVRWQVLDWNEAAIKMYKKVHADFYTNWWTCKLESEKIKNYTPI
jgi:ribosomal protein S18 acetylase RimI-like enzyme